MLIAAIMIALAFLAFAFGVQNLTQATLGIGFIAIACFFGIVGRIAQAQAHHAAAQQEKTRAAGSQSNG